MDKGLYLKSMVFLFDNAELDQATYIVSLRANGGDHWYFDSRLHAEFSDSSKRDWTFLTNDLKSERSTRISKEFRLSK